MGTVWLAHDEKLERAVAVKRIGVEDPDVGRRAQREARAAARLSHPGIVALYESGQDEDAVYLVSELVRGRTLARLMADGLLSDRDVVEIGLVLCDALAHAHQRGVVHRDVKPANVMVPDDGGGAKLTDFGIAQLIGDDALTRTGDVVGTLAYMAPEQAEGRAATWSVDLYALGLVLFEALSGVNPVRGRTPASTIRRVGERLPAPGPPAPRPPARAVRGDRRRGPPAPRAARELGRPQARAQAAARASTTSPARSRPGPSSRSPRAAASPRTSRSSEPATRARRQGAEGAAALGTPRLASRALALPRARAPVRAPSLGAAAAAGADARRSPGPGWVAGARGHDRRVAGLAGPGPGGARARGARARPRARAAGAAGVVERPGARRCSWAPPGWRGLGRTGRPGAPLAPARRARGRSGRGGSCSPSPSRAARSRSAPRPARCRARRGRARRPVPPSALAPLLSPGRARARGASGRSGAVRAAPGSCAGRRAGADLVAAVAWTRGVAAGAQAACAALRWPGGSPGPAGLVGGAVVAGIIAVAARAAGGPSRSA
jgi:hypothetical protein